MNGKQGMLDEILNSIDNEEVMNAEQDANDYSDDYGNADDDFEKTASAKPSGLSEMVRASGQESFAEKLYSMTDGLTKEASVDDTEMLMKVAEESINDLENIVEQAKMLGKIAAEEFKKNI